MRRINSRSSFSARSSITAGIVTVAGRQEQPPAIVTLHYHDIRKPETNGWGACANFLLPPVQSNRWWPAVVVGRSFDLFIHEERTMKTKYFAAAGLAAMLVLLTTQAVPASSHREALAILNEPCADNTDTYAWVSDGSHDKLNLIMDYYPLHEPGQGNHGLRACNGYRYEFHIGTGPGLDDKVVYRVEFTNKLTPAPAPSATDRPGGGNELLWQLTFGTETMKVTRLRFQTPFGASSTPIEEVVLGDNIPVLPNNHGPQTDRAIYGLAPFKGYDSGDPTTRTIGLYDQAFVDRYIRSLSNGARIIAGQFDDPYQLDEKGIFDLVNLSRDDLGGIAGARHQPAEDVFTGFNIFSIALEVPTSEVFPDGIPHNDGVSRPSTTDSLLRVWARITRQKTQTVDNGNIVTGLKGSGKFVQVGRNALPLF